MASPWPTTSARASLPRKQRWDLMQNVTERSFENIGGKATRLLELQRAGFRVPDFICNPADAAPAIEKLGVPLAVRSSASAEDGPEVSFAGQFRSFLNLR